MKIGLLKDESGFTLTEVLVTTIMMVVVLSALLSVTDMSLRAFSYGNNKLEAVETSRVALEKMEREIRQAYVYHRANNDLHLFDQRTANRDQVRKRPRRQQGYPMSHSGWGPGRTMRKDRLPA